MNYDLLNSKCKHFQRSAVYIASHEIAVHYSHNNAERLVGVHSRYAKSAKGDTDLIVLGEDKIKGDDLVKQAMLENLE